MNIDYSILPVAQEEFEGHFIRDFLNRRIFLSLDNFDQIATICRNILCDIFNTNSFTPFVPRTTQYNKEISVGIIIKDPFGTRFIFERNEYCISYVDFNLKISSDSAEICVTSISSEVDKVLYNYKISQDGIETENNIFDISTESLNFAECLDKWKSLYEY